MLAAGAEVSRVVVAEALCVLSVGATIATRLTVIVVTPLSE